MLEIEKTEKELLLDWLDSRIQSKVAAKFSDDIFDLDSLDTISRRIHVNNAANIAERIGYDLHTSSHSDEYTQEYFMYHGWEFFSLKSIKTEEETEDVE